MIVTTLAFLVLSYVKFYLKKMKLESECFIVFPFCLFPLTIAGASFSVSHC